jgi:hypothetical protein
MSFFDTVLSDTVGPVWRAATGTVDPWTKAAIIDDSSDDLVKSSGGTITKEQAVQQQAAIVTNVLTNQVGNPYNTPGGSTSADPSAAVQGLKDSLNLAGDYGLNIGKSILYAGIGLALIYSIFTFGPSLSRWTKS